MSLHVIYLRRQGLELYLRGNDTPLIFPFPDKSVEHLEVQREAELHDALVAFVKEAIGLKQKFSIVVSEDALFHKAFSNEDPKVREESEKEFAIQVPLDPDNVGKITIALPDQSHVFVINQQLYRVIMSALDEIKGSVVLVTPAFLYAPEEQDTSVFGQQAGLSAQILQAAQSQHSPYPNSNFLHADNSYLLKEKQKGEIKTVNQKVTVGILIVIILISMSVSIFMVANAFLPKKTTAPVSSTPPQETEEIVEPQ